MKNKEPLMPGEEGPAGVKVSAAIEEAARRPKESRRLLTAGPSGKYSEKPGRLRYGDVPGCPGWERGGNLRDRKGGVVMTGLETSPELARVNG